MNVILKKKYALHEKDTGSTALQIISLREGIRELIKHGENHRRDDYLQERKRSDGKRKKDHWKDVPARRALLKKIAKERRFFKYLQRKNPSLYEQLKQELGSEKQAKIKLTQ